MKSGFSLDKTSFNVGLAPLDAVLPTHLLYHGARRSLEILRRKFGGCTRDISSLGALHERGTRKCSSATNPLGSVEILYFSLSLSLALPFSPWKESLKSFKRDSGLNEMGTYMCVETRQRQKKRHVVHSVAHCSELKLAPDLTAAVPHRADREFAAKERKAVVERAESADSENLQGGSRNAVLASWRQSARSVRRVQKYIYIKREQKNVCPWYFLFIFRSITAGFLLISEIIETLWNVQ